MKKQPVKILVWLTAFVVSAVCAYDAYAGQNTLRTREEIAKYRAEHPVKARVKANTPAARVHAGDKQLYALQCSAYEGLWEWGSGAVKVIEGANSPEPVFQMDGVVFQGAYMNGKMFTVLFDAFGGATTLTYQVYDATTWDLEASANYTISSSYILPGALAYDHTTGNLYGSFYAEPGSFYGAEDMAFGTIDFTNAFDPIKRIADQDVIFRAMTFDKDGNLFAMDYVGDLYEVNKYTGAATPTGVHVDLPVWDDGDPSAPFDSYGRESMCCDWESGDFFIAYSDDMFNSYLARFNPTTGDVELVADYSYSDFGSGDCNILTALYFEQKAEQPTTTTPAAVSDLTITAVGTELKAEVTFTMPSVDSEGNDLDADLTWTVSDGNNDLATGTAHSGAEVTATVELTKEGRSTLVVTVALKDAVSNPTTGAAFFGCDTPEIYGLPTARVSGSNVTVKWEEAYAVNGGNLDPITYKVTRMPDEVVVAEANTTNSFVDKIESDIKTTYYYTIQPFAGTKEGAAVTSRTAVVGKYIGMPLDEKFEDEQWFLQYPVIDANNDDNVWEYSTKYNGTAIYAANDNDADDYLLIGPFKMEGGCAYTFHMTADGHNFKETIALYVGTDADDVNTFTTELIAPTILDPMKGEKSFDVAFEPETSGDYYFGIKACSTGASQFIYVYDVAVKEVASTAPAPPVAFDVVLGETTATLNFTLSDKCLNGEAVSGLTEVRIYRDNVLIGTINEGVTPGAELSFTDEDTLEKGYYNYAVAAVNNEGEGKTAVSLVYRGLDFPGCPENVRIWEDLDTPGMLHITFDHPAHGYYGGYVNNDDVIYLINYLVMGKDSGVIELGKGTEHTFKLPFDVTAQDIFAGSIYGRNSRGYVAQSGNWATQVAYIGPALSLPLQESWAGQTSKSGIWGGQSLNGSTTIGEAYWGISDGTSYKVTPQDYDAGLMSFGVTVDNTGKRILSPRVSLEGAENPAAVFYYYYTEQLTDFNVEVLVDDQPIKTILPLDLNPDHTGEWVRVVLPLDEYKGCKYIQLGFAAIGLKGEHIACIDNFTLTDLCQYDLTVKAFNAPLKADANTPVTLTVTVRNNGAETADAADYNVVFYKNGEELGSIEGVTMMPDAVETFTFVDTPSVLDPAQNTYSAEIAYSKDLRPADNTTSEATVRIIIADYPTVSNLQGVYAKGITLTWNDPDMSQIPGISVTETFESYKPFIIENIGSWGLHDGDGYKTVVMATSLGVLSYEHIGEPMAWQVFDPEAANIPLAAWFARSGRNMLVSFQASDNGNRQIACNDWLISPELNASEQVISFYAHAGNSSYAPEVFDFMVSDKTAAIADFKVLAADVEVLYTGGEWVEYTYRVPAGTRYFAIVHKSVDKVAMLLDDITYIPAGSTPVQLDLEGFNVYRDGVRLNAEPIADNMYNDTDVVKGQDYNYCVSAVYDKGESNVSETITVKALQGVDATATYQLTISGHQGFIRIVGGIGEQAEIYTASGVCVASVKAEGNVEVAVAPGIYIVRAGDASAKIAVR